MLRVDDGDDGVNVVDGDMTDGKAADAFTAIILGVEAALGLGIMLTMLMTMVSKMMVPLEGV